MYPAYNLRVWQATYLQSTHLPVVIVPNWNSESDTSFDGHGMLAAAACSIDLVQQVQHQSSRLQDNVETDTLVLYPICFESIRDRCAKLLLRVPSAVHHVRQAMVRSAQMPLNWRLNTSRPCQGLPVARWSCGMWPARTLCASYFALYKDQTRASSWWKDVLATSCVLMESIMKLDL